MLIRRHTVTKKIVRRLANGLGLHDADRFVNERYKKIRNRLCALPAPFRYPPTDLEKRLMVSYWKEAMLEEHKDWQIGASPQATEVADPSLNRGSDDDADLGNEVESG